MTVPNYPELRRLDAEITLHASQVQRLQKRVEALEKKEASEPSTGLQEPKTKPKAVHWKREPGPSGSGSDKEGGQVASTKEWYEGGTLHDKSAIEWQTASSADKVATCADFVAAMWQKGHLKRSIAKHLSTIDDVRPYAEELVECLDAAFKPDPDPEVNRKLFANQTVSGTAAIGMVIMGWTE